MSEEPKTEIPKSIDLKLLKGLSETRGASGHETKIRNYIKEQIKPFCNVIKTDSMGNLFGIIEGNDDENTVLVAAHMDEIGFMIRYIDENGFLRVVRVGGQNYRLLPGTRVIVDGKNGDVPGIFGEKAIHLIKSKERNKVTPLEDCFVDIGAKSKEHAEKNVSIGDFIEFEQSMVHFEDSTLVNGKAFDDRIGCYIMIEAMKSIANGDKPEHTIVFAFTSQEEIGTRGAIVAGYHINPTSALVLEVTHGIDYPSVSKSKDGDISLSKGPVIDVGPNLHPKISKRIIELAKKLEIPYQIEPEPYPTGTDARSIQISRSGIPVGLVCVPLRYMHTMIETIDLIDLDNAVKLVTAYLTKKISKNYDF